uniref:Uncharacterized protein n=1 Tax=Trichuris muris TaxID=70415 RepID=A0A5S6QZ12_TRIMR
MIIGERGSRRVVKEFLQRAQEAYECSNRLNEELTCEVETAEAETELEKQLNYLQKMEGTAAAVDVYLQLRINDAPSVVSHSEEDNDGGSLNLLDRADCNTVPANPNTLDASRGSTQRLEVEDVAACCLDNLRIHEPTSVDSPDQWIEDYVAGRCMPKIGMS